MDLFLVTYLGEPKGSSGEEYGTPYDLSAACKICGTGARVEHALNVKGLKNIKRNVFQTLDGDWLISENFYQLFRKNNVLVHGLKQVVHYKSRHQLPYYHLDADQCLPKCEEMKGLVVEGQCQTCKRNGFFNDVIIGDLSKGIPTKIQPIELGYKNLNLSFLNESDFLCTWEHLGLSCRKPDGNSVVRYARPFLVVSERARTLMEEGGIEDLKFEALVIL